MRFFPLLAASSAFAIAAFAADSTVIFNEIHYNPAAGQQEFIELRNLHGVDMHVGGWKIDGGVDFTFPANTVVPGGGYVLVGAVAGALGNFTGQLDNGGETLRLRNLNGRIMDELNYGDAGEWPLAADGSGATLSRRAASAAEGAAAWTASTAIGGTPGAENFAVGGPINRSLIAARDLWKYRDADAAPPADWASAAFSDAAWTQGNAVLGTPGGTPTLTVTTDLVERFRASAITGLANGATVATWLDGATGDGSQDAVAGATTPTFRVNVTPSGKAVVRFDGNDELRTTILPGITPTGGFVYFVVVKALGAQGDGNFILDRHLTGGGAPLVSIKPQSGFFALQKRYDDNSGLGGPVSATPISTAAFQIVAVRRNRTLNRFEMWVNGVMEATEADTGGALNPDPVNIGRHATTANGGLIGDIAEVLIYKSELTDADFLSVGGYLESEYGLDTAFPGSAVATPLSVTAPTSYFRKTFTSPGNAALTALRLSHLVADGAVFYLNGVEILRTNLPGGAVAHTTPASSIIANPASSGAISVPNGSLVSGTNVLAVSLHKAIASPGVLFDATLESTETPADPNVDQFRFSEIAAFGSPTFYVELRNPTANPVSTNGWSIKSSDGQTAALAAQNVAAGGYVVFNIANLGFTPTDGARLFLIAPGGTEVRDARTVTAQLRGLLPDGRWGRPDSATPGAANLVTISSAIVINEIFYNADAPTPPALPSGEQWVELHNRSGAPVDVSLWKFSDGIDFLIPAATPQIPAGGFLVVAWNPATFATLHPGVTALGPFTGSLSGKGETITLRDANDNVADQVTYADGGRWSQWADGGGSSLELIDPDADNTRGEAWDASDESGDSTWQNVSITDAAALNPGSNPTTWNEFNFGLLNAGEFLIDDISVTQAGTQLIQNGNFTAGNANFWRIIGTHSGSVVSDGGNNVLKVVATAETEHMHNHAGTTLKNGASFHTIVAANTYIITFRAKWLRGSNALHSRMYVNRLPLKTLLNRPTTGGTPGAQNSRFNANAGPTFDALSHSPVVPAATVPATVSVKVADADGIATVELFRSVNGAAFTSTNMATAGGEIYTGTVAGQAASATVQFYIRATDSLGAVSFFPAGGPASRAMIPWADGRAQLTLPSGAKPHNVRVIMPGADANNLYRHENLMSNAAIPCTVIYDEREVYYRAGVALKSSEHGRFNINRVGYNIEFPADDLFLGTHGGISIDRSGGTSAGQKEILIKQLSILAGGIHAPQDDIIRLIPARATGTGFQFDGAGMLGAAILSKTRLKGDYLDNQWENGGDGMMFKYERIYVLTQTINAATRVVDGAIVPENPKIPQDTTSPLPHLAPPGVNVTNLGANSELYRWHWLVESGRNTDDFAGIMNVTNAIGQPAGATFNSLVTQYIDVDAWTRAHVPGVLYGVVDNYLAANGAGSLHNVLFYFPPGKKAVLFPWDMDFLNQSNPTAVTLATGGDIAKFISNPAWKRLYYGHMLDVLNRSFNTATMTTWATHYSRFGTDDMVASVAAYLTPRANYAREFVTGTNGQTAPVPFVVFARTSASPATVSTPFATVTGNGWINLAEIRLLGSAEPLAITWTGQSTWSVQLPISAGTNLYTLVPYDKYGVQLGNTVTGGTLVTATVTITGSGGIFPAAPGNLVVSELNYNPVGTTDATEFIELLNITGATLALGGCHFDEELGQGIAYTFPAGVQIAPGARILVVRDRVAFEAMYGAGLPLAPGVFTGALDNSGESIVLYSAGGLELFRFSYSDNLASTDGGGRTLVRQLNSANPNPSAYAWRESTQLNGNPNATDAVLFTGTPLADLDGDGFHAIIEYVCGTSDTNPASRPAPAQFVFDMSGNVTATFPIVPNADDAIASPQTAATLGIGWLPHTVPVPVTPTRFFRLSVTPR